MTLHVHIHSLLNLPLKDEMTQESSLTSLFAVRDKIILAIDTNDKLIAHDMVSYIYGLFITRLGQGICRINPNRVRG